MILILHYCDLTLGLFDLLLVCCPRLNLSLKTHIQSNAILWDLREYFFLSGSLVLIPINPKSVSADEESVSTCCGERWKLTEIH